MKIALASLLPVAFSLAWFGQAPPAPATPSAEALSAIGFVSGQRLMTESAEGKAALARLQVQQQEKTAGVRAVQQALEVTRKELATVTDPAMRLKLQQQELQQRTEVEQKTVQAQNELQALQRQFQTQIQDRVRPMIAEAAAARQFQLVLNADTSVLWAASLSNDLTPALIQRLDARPVAQP